MAAGGNLNLIRHRRDVAIPSDVPCEGLHAHGDVMSCTVGQLSGEGASMSALHVFDYGLGVGTLLSVLSILLWVTRGRPVR